jgi:hypothetical protein
MSPTENENPFIPFVCGGFRPTGTEHTLFIGITAVVRANASMTTDIEGDGMRLYWQTCCFQPRRLWRAPATITLPANTGD